MENSSAFPAGLNFVTKAQLAVSEGAPRAVDVSGKSGELVVPATYSEPEESTAIPFTLSEYAPPRYVTQSVNGGLVNAAQFAANAMKAGRPRASFMTSDCRTLPAIPGA